ncbi:Fatty acid cis/trans isomerase, partial [hydrothermal vent metagenome]
MSRRYKIITRKHLLIISAVLLLGFLASEILTSQFTMKDIPASIESDLAIAAQSEPVTWENQVKPVLERRCVVCHGCYDAPCQLKL